MTIGVDEEGERRPVNAAAASATPANEDDLSLVADALDALARVLRYRAAKTATAPAAQDSDPMLTVVEAADELACSASHVRTQCASGAIKAFRTDGGKYRIRMSALRAYERRRTGRS